MQHQNLFLYRGARFRAHAWVITDEDGHPRRDINGVNVKAQVRTWAGAAEALHTFATRAVLVALPGQYDDQPVAVAQIDEMSPEQTAELTWATGVYDVVVNSEPVAGGRVIAPWAVSRT